MILKGRERQRPAWWAVAWQGRKTMRESRIQPGLDKNVKELMEWNGRWLDLKKPWAKETAPRQKGNSIQPEWVLPGGASDKEPTCQYRECKRLRFDPWVWKIPWRKKWQPIPVFLPGKSHGQRSLAGYSPSDHKSWTRLSDETSTTNQSKLNENWEMLALSGKDKKVIITIFHEFKN